MKFATFFNDDYSVYGIDSVDEYNITFDVSKSDYEKLQNRMIEWGKKRVNLMWIGILDIDKIKALKKLHPNLYIRITPEHFGAIGILKEEKIKFFLDWTIMINTYILLDWVLKEIKPAEIYIGDDLCFNLHEVEKLCSKHDVGIRIILNRIPTMNPLTGLAKTAPIFRPEDMDLLNLYFTCGELDLSENDQPFNEYYCKWNKLEVLYRRWFKEKQWLESLNYLNRDIAFNFANQYIPLDFTYYKIKCKHRCSMLAESQCSQCGRYIKQAMEAEDNIEDK